MDFQSLDNTDGLIFWSDLCVLNFSYPTTTTTTTTATTSASTTNTPTTHTQTLIYRIHIYVSVCQF